MIESIKKRDGRVVPFERAKIELAITKACIATNLLPNTAVVSEITTNVIQDLQDLGKIPEVELVQDLVEKEISKHGLFDVAKKYILYRHEHTLLREKENEERKREMMKHALKVVNRSGKKEPFDIGKVRSIIKKYSDNKIDPEELKRILNEIKNGIFENISTTEISQLIIMALNARIEKDPVYSYYSARFLLNMHYKDVLGVDEFDRKFDSLYRLSLKKQIEKSVKIGRQDDRLLQFDFDTVSNALDLSYDKLLKYMGIETLYERYFARDYEQHVLELPQHFFMRVAMGLALSEKEGEREAYAISFYDRIASLHYVPSTPTLFHAGTTHAQMSSCYLTTVEDDLASIFKCIADNAQLSKWSGGLGNDWTNIRGTGALIKSTNVSSQGVIPFLKIDDATTAAINRSGKRRGAACVYLETWHYDIEDFIELRKNTGDERRRIHDTDTANWIPDLFMKRVQEDGEWTLFSPDETPDLHHLYGKKFEKRYVEYERMADEGKITLFKRIKAVSLWRKMITQLFETGHPWIVFKDPCNIRSPQDHVGVIHSSNLCTEITLNTSEEETAVCNLGSLNIANYITKGKKLDKKALAKDIPLAIRMLDNIIDYNYYPTTESKTANERHRPIGLGIMGVQDALYIMGLDYDSEEAVAFSDELMEFVSYHAILSSSKLAKERGTYSTYKGSKWDRNIFPVDTIALLEKERSLSTGVNKKGVMDWRVVRDHVKKYGMRNSNTMAIAPTATISTIAGCYPSFEAIYENLYVKSNQTGEFTVINEFLVQDLKDAGLWGDETQKRLKFFDGSVQQMTEIPRKLRNRYKEVFEIDPVWSLKHAAVRGKWIDQSQSLNIFLATESGKVIADVYMRAWEMGLKTTYYLRSLGASRIEKSTLDINVNYGNVEVQEEEKVFETLSIPQCKIDDPDCEACQ